MRRSFDLLAKPYHLLEALTFGSALQSARVRFINDIPNPQRVLILGEGDGRFLAAFRNRHPSARVDVIDASPTMLALAAQADPSPRTTFIHADATQHPLPSAEYDLIVTHFFLDCFPQPQVDTLIHRLAQSATPNASWLIADFHQPPSGLKRAHASLWLTTMYAFFRLTTPLQAHRLPTYDPPLTTATFQLQSQTTFRYSLIRSTMWQRTPLPPSPTHP